MYYTLVQSVEKITPPDLQFGAREIKSDLNWLFFCFNPEDSMTN